ncbi:hypothetical protein M2132_000836 [Dysgonomonas sp. PH5-45]|uniref:hypothetical protein n=1 Tax=unclassified Dysgonomonas TaxID=2630389 RepID=UPI002474DBD4|nr:MULTISPECIES: hypothetical protein [unclassified Dysgonomonas]MDH6354508.1 hypothetical protein [Dysgonomonas sp. PH5-45]MDH6387435.1 hypothetical protein [Dysgonomonas sp. PH5-37]
MYKLTNHKTLILVAFVLTFAVVLCTSCSSSADEVDLTGRWESSSDEGGGKHIIEFFSYNDSLDVYSLRMSQYTVDANGQTSVPDSSRWMARYRILDKNVVLYTPDPHFYTGTQTQSRQVLFRTKNDGNTLWIYGQDYILQKAL